MIIIELLAVRVSASNLCALSSGGGGEQALLFALLPPPPPPVLRTLDTKDGASEPVGTQLALTAGVSLLDSANDGRPTSGLSSHKRTGRPTHLGRGHLHRS